MIKKLTHDEILHERKTNEESLACERHPIYVMLDNIRSLYNVGSFFRTCDSALVKELILCGFTPHPPRKEIEKTALGATDSVPWKYFKESLDAMAYLKDLGVKTFAVELTDKKRYYDTLQAEEYPLCLILGNELTGISDNILSVCDASIEIPMYGVKHSLNVSIAGGIVIFDAVRQLKKFL